MISVVYDIVLSTLLEAPGLTTENDVFWGYVSGDIANISMVPSGKQT